MTPKTTEWAFVSIDRSNDYTVSSNRYFRDNWVVTRKRISNEPYVSQLGELAESLSGFNGGETETVLAPTIAGLSFNITRNWINSSWVFLQTQNIMNGFPVYLPFPQPAVGLPQSEGVSVLLRADRTQIGSFAWSVYQETRKNVEEGIFKSNLFDTPHARSSNTGSSLNNRTLDNSYGGFSGNSTIIVGDFPQKFQCSTDSQRYIDEGVAWYTQEQTWRVLSSWRIEDV